MPRIAPRPPTGHLRGVKRRPSLLATLRARNSYGEALLRAPCLTSDPLLCGPVQGRSRVDGGVRRGDPPSQELGVGCLKVTLRKTHPGHWVVNLPRRPAQMFQASAPSGALCCRAIPVANPCAAQPVIQPTSQDITASPGVMDYLGYARSYYTTDPWGPALLAGQTTRCEHSVRDIMGTRPMCSSTTLPLVYLNRMLDPYTVKSFLTYLTPKRLLFLSC